MIKMIIAPLIFATLVAGIAGAGHVKAVGRMGLRAIIYFEIVTTIALVIGLVAVNLTRPGVGVVLPPSARSGRHRARAQTWDQVLLHVVPESVIDAMARGDVLQIVVFSILFAIALGMIGERGRPVVVWCEVVAETMFKFTDIVMRYAPIGVGAAIAYTVGHSGFGVLYNLAWLVGTLYAALIAFILLVLLPVALMFRIDIPRFISDGPRAGDHRVLHHVERSGAAAGDGSDGALRRAAPHRLVRDAARLQLQSRRHDAVSVAGGGLRRAGGRRRADRLAAVHDAPDADADQQGRRRRAARVAGHPRRHARVVRLAARRGDADSRRGRADGHGAHDDQRHRQLPGHGDRRAVGGAAVGWCRSCAGPPRCRDRRPGRCGRAGTPADGVTRQSMGATRVLTAGGRSRRAAGYTIGIEDSMAHQRLAILVAVSLLAWGSPAATAEQSQAPPIERLIKVDERLYRGAQPSEAGFRHLRELGVKTIVNLRMADDALRTGEQRMVEALGFKYINIPVEDGNFFTRSRTIPEDAIRSFFKIVDDAEHGTVFVHCHRGADRTGAMVAFYRMARQGWTADRAGKEARDVGLRSWYRGLQRQIATFTATAFAASTAQD